MKILIRNVKNNKYKKKLVKIETCRFFFTYNGNIKSCSNIYRCKII